MAIKIIKPGKKPDTTERFECSNCGCVFDADRGDYEKGYSMGIGSYLRIYCPVCKRTVYRLRDE